jgi:hypothetical protein
MGILDRAAPLVLGLPGRLEFSWEQTVWFLLWQYYKIRRAPQENVFLLRQYSIHAEHHHVGDDQLLWLRLLSAFYFLQSKIKYRRSKNCSAGNPPPRGNPGLKRTRMDNILKKFEF